MIHYILIPEKERRAMRREYRLRLAIVSLLFLSTVIIIGVLCLLPAFVYIQNQEKDMEAQKSVIQQTLKETGADVIEKELVKTQAIAEKILAVQQPISLEEVIQHIGSHRTKDVLLASFVVTSAISTTTVADVTVNGKALTRDGLLNFKKKLENDPYFTAVHLPISDLAKSRDISFAMTMKIKKP